MNSRFRLFVKIPGNFDKIYVCDDVFVTYTSNVVKTQETFRDCS